jgi:hypothetical protein
VRTRYATIHCALLPLPYKRCNRAPRSCNRARITTSPHCATLRFAKHRTLPVSHKSRATRHLPRLFRHHYFTILASTGTNNTIAHPHRHSPPDHRLARLQPPRRRHHQLPPLCCQTHRRWCPHDDSRDHKSTGSDEAGVSRDDPRCGGQLTNLCSESGPSAGPSAPAGGDWKEGLKIPSKDARPQTEVHFIRAYTQLALPTDMMRAGCNSDQRPRVRGLFH